MKKQLAKFNPFLRLTRRSFSRVACFGTIILIYSSAFAQNLFVSSDAAGGQLYEFNPTGVRTTFASGIAGALAFDKTGNLFVSNLSNFGGNIYKFTTNGARTKFASGFNWSWPLACDNAGNLFVATGDSDLNDFPINGSGKIYKFTAGGVRTTFASGLDNPSALAFDSAGNLFVANIHTVVQDQSFNGTIYKFTAAGARTTFAGLHNPEALAFDNAGNLFVADPGPGSGLIYKFSPSGVRSTFAGGFSWAGSLACDSAGNLFVADSPAYAIYKITPAGVRSTFAATDGVNVLAFGPPRATTPALVNISARGSVETGNNALISGFIISGTDNKKILLRALGPSLGNSGITDALQDPTIELHDGTGAMIASNDNWKDTQQAEITATSLAPSHDLESAILYTFAPGSYTAIVRGKNNTTGTALVEAYDADEMVNAHLSNVSMRGFVDLNNRVMIAGFIVSEGGSVNIVVRTLGPTLTQSGVAGALQDPTLTLYDANGTQIAFNNNWKDTQQALIQASGIAPLDDRESAIEQALTPGNYTIIERGNNNTTGVGLIEVYKLP